MYLSPRKFLFLLFIFGGGINAFAQSTLASITGTVRDATDATVSGAQIHLHRVESNTDRNVTSGSDGSYTALNLEPGTYNVQVVLSGFAPRNNTNIHLDSRQQLRLDVSLSPATVTQDVQVDASDVGVITTDDASISAALSPRDVLDLPANYRGAGSTSPLNVIQTLPGVQPDSGSYPPTPSASPNPSIKFSIQGGLPSQSETTVDGISAQNQTSNNIQADAFPSAESIAEIRVDGVNNNAEYGQPGEITTVTKSGTNAAHGSAFWYFQNSGFDAIPFGYDKTTKPKKVANDFGGSFGGPLVLPRLYNGHNRTFVFGTYEGLRFPQSVGRQQLVPTVRMKQGDFSQETSTLTNPFTGGTYPGQVLPINPSSAAFLSVFPDPNIGGDESLATARATRGYNYVSTRRNDINSNQFDVRGDQNFGQKLALFARYTFKNINQSQPADFNLPNGTGFARYRIFATSANYAFTPHLVDEFRFGFTLEQDGNANPFNGVSLTDNANFVGIGPTFPFNGLSNLNFNGRIAGGGSRLNGSQRSRIFQYVDNLTWQHGAHTVRVGADLRHLGAYTVRSFFPSDNFGNFSFDGRYTGQEFGDFLIGAPYLSQVDNITSDNTGTANAYAFYAQDNWKATPNLNITFGLRYEFHPAFSTNTIAIGNFDPSVAKSGRVIYNAGHAGELDPEELASFNACTTAGVTNPSATDLPVNGAPCTPVLSNTEAGLPVGLRTSSKLRFEPRLGFAYRPFGNDRTAIRGGVGYYNITTTGALFYALTGTVSANVRSYYNSAAGTPPVFSFPKVSPAGSTFTPDYANPSVVFYSAIDTNWHDPYSLQTDLSVDHDLGRGFGMRISYVGLKTWHLVWQPEFNMLPYSKTTLAVDQPRTAFPFPNFLSLPDRATSAQASYQSGQAELSHRFGRGLSFDAAYTYAKNLSDNQGSYGTFSAPTFVDEQGGYNATYSYDRHIDYGNVTGTRRHRFLSSGVYELPLGHGKRFGGGMNRFADLALGGWQISGIFLMQTGPFLTPFIPSGNVDPSGTGSSSIYTSAQRPDRIANGNNSHHTRSNWLNSAAFTCPGGVGRGGSTGFASLQADANGYGNCVVGGVDPETGVHVAPIGRFGSSSLGDVIGPGTVSLSNGLSKSFALTEGLRLRAEGTFTNILNHTNLADPVLDVTNSSFGVITQARGSDFGGNRTGQVSMKLEF